MRHSLTQEVRSQTTVLARLQCPPRQAPVPNPPLAISSSGTRAAAVPSAAQVAYSPGAYTGSHLARRGHKAMPTGAWQVTETGETRLWNTQPSGPATCFPQTWALRTRSSVRKSSRVSARLLREQAQLSNRREGARVPLPDGPRGSPGPRLPVFPPFPQDPGDADFDANSPGDVSAPRQTSAPRERRQRAAPL